MITLKLWRFIKHPQAQFDMAMSCDFSDETDIAAFKVKVAEMFK